MKSPGTIRLQRIDAGEARQALCQAAAACWHGFPATSTGLDRGSTQPRPFLIQVSFALLPSHRACGDNREEAMSADKSGPQNGVLRAGNTG
jgi:hypothetical protein